MKKMRVIQLDPKEVTAWDVLTDNNIFIVSMMDGPTCRNRKTGDVTTGKSHPRAKTLSFSSMSNTAIQKAQNSFENGTAAIVRVTFEDEP